MNTHPGASQSAIFSAPSSPSLRFITATSRFDGHDAAINIIRRLLQANGVEVIHLGHNRNVDELVNAAVHEDADALAVSCYQGGHIEFFEYLVERLESSGLAGISVFGGGGGVILPDEVKKLRALGVAAIYSPEDGQKMGLQGMIDDMLRICRQRSKPAGPAPPGWRRLSEKLTTIELDPPAGPEISKAIGKQAIVLGITGSGGSGKSSLIDELLWRFRQEYKDRLKIALIAIDPSRVKTGGALLGDRLRMNALNSSNIYMRSMATRKAGNEMPAALPAFVRTLQQENFDLILIETPGIGQGSTGIVSMADINLYVMTREFGAPSQLEKINMLDYCDLVALNKFDDKNSVDALLLVQKQLQRNRGDFDKACSTMPVYGTIAARCNDEGTSRLYVHLRQLLNGCGLPSPDRSLTVPIRPVGPPHDVLIPSDRQYYLADIARVVRAYRSKADQQAELAHQIQGLSMVRNQLDDSSAVMLDEPIKTKEKCLDPALREALKDYLDHHVNPSLGSDADMLVTLSGLAFPKVARPTFRGHGDLLRWLMLENLPGKFPFTAGVFRSKRSDEAATRMFAGEGGPESTNQRFKYLCQDSDAQRLSTAFDSVTLYGCDPDEQPDILGKIGNSGVSVATLNDMKSLFQGFDLCHPKTSVSMTINGPAPILLAMFFDTAIDQQLAKFTDEHKRPPDARETEKIRRYTLQTVRGTVQADILKEDQGQNTCIFSIDFSLRLLADVQRYFIEQKILHFYSMSVSGYHIAEAGANPITQLAFTLANGFSYVEIFRARGMKVDDFAHRLSFFFSNGMDPEYAVIGRVARRIWAVAMRDHYGVGKRSQKLKYHIQTSGRSLHAQTVDFNEIRTTLQALNAVYDQCNSLHTNARDEAITTPTEETLRSALAIQAIINKEWGLAQNENSNQGSFIIEYLTDQVEQAVLDEFDRLSQRGGVLGGMDSGYQRSKIQEESLRYESGKNNGSIPIIGLNTLRSLSANKLAAIKPVRSSTSDKRNQIQRLRRFHERNRNKSAAALEKLKQTVIKHEAIFPELMQTVRSCSLGQITQAFYEVGGQYRRAL